MFNISVFFTWLCMQFMFMGQYIYLEEKCWLKITI